MKRFRQLSCLCLSSFLCVVLGSVSVHGGELRGRVSVPNEEKSPAPRRYFKGPYRSGHSHVAVPDSPENVVVYFPDIKIPSAAGDGRKARRPPVMRQVNERFVPHVLAVTKGDSVRFTNEDDYYHNVFSVVSGDRFDLGRFAEGVKTTNPFNVPGVVVVRCEIHPRMKAYVLVLETPTFVIPDASGAFVFRDIPDGRHRVLAWHPVLGTWEGSVEIQADAPASVVVAF